MLDNLNVMDYVYKYLTLFIQGCSRKFLYLALIYGVAASLMTLAVPISVQMLVNTVANLGITNTVSILATLLFGILCSYGALIICQRYALELFSRRFYAEMVGHFSLRGIFADHVYYRSINGQDLTNRYFDIMSVQKIVPTLITGLFATLLQMLVGIVLVSFYHPWLLLFNILFVLSFYVLCRVWMTRSMVAAIGVSHAKYNTARHLHDVAQSNDFHKSSIRAEKAFETSDNLATAYIEAREKYFKHTFRQEIAFRLFYAISSAILLGLGGLLVIQEELTLGQFIAAELILMAVLSSISRFSYYLTDFYELSASIEEISLLFHVPLEQPAGERLFDRLPEPHVSFENIICRYNHQDIAVHLHIKKGDNVLLTSSHANTRHCITDLLQGYVQPDRGRIMMNDHDIRDYHTASLRDAVIVLDTPVMIETSIIDYLRSYAPGTPLAAINDVLELTEMIDTIEALPNGMDTLILANGSPLKSTEILRLKLAGALLARPQILVLNDYYDAISSARRKRIFRRLCHLKETIILYFSYRHDIDTFDRYIFVDHTSSTEFDTVAELQAFECAYEENN